MGEVSGDLEGEEVPEGGEEDELDGAQPEEGEAQPDVEGHLHQEEIPEKSLVGDGEEDEDPMVQNHQPDGLAELVSNLGVDIDGIDVGLDEEGLDLEGEEEQDFDYENQQNQEEDLVGEEYLDQDYMEGDQVGEVFDEGEGHQAYYDEEQEEEEEDDEAYNDEEEGDFYQAYAQQPQVKKPKLQEQEEEVILESSDEEEESNSVPAAAAKTQQWPQQRLPQQFGLQQPLHQQQQQQGRAPIQAQFGLQQLQQQAMYAELLHGRGSGQQQFHQFAPSFQRKRRRRTPTALCIKDGRVFLRPFTDLPPHISAKSLSPPEQSPYQPSSAMAASLMPSAISGHHLGSALGLGNPLGALGQLGHPTMGQQLGQQQAAAFPSLLPQFHQYPQHQVGFNSLSCCGDA